jgi:hypothetical protein
MYKWYFSTILAILLVEETGIPMEKTTDQSQVTDKSRGMDRTKEIRYLKKNCKKSGG